MEERVSRLEVEVVNLRVQHASVAGSLDNLTEVVNELREVVQELRDTMNRGQGAIWLFGVGAAAFGSLVPMLLKKLLG